MTSKCKPKNKYPFCFETTLILPQPLPKLYTPAHAGVQKALTTRDGKDTYIMGQIQLGCHVNPTFASFHGIRMKRILTRNTTILAATVPDKKEK
jgi:hypothetical protein